MEIVRIHDENNNLLAIVIPDHYSSNSSQFLTPPEYSMQVGIVTCKARSVTARHYHPDSERKITQTMECVFIKRGSLLMEFYDLKKELISDYIAKIGDIVFLISGGHSITYLTDSEIVEIRQGPYNKEFDKILF